MGWGTSEVSLTQCLKACPPSELSMKNIDWLSRSREIISELLWKRGEIYLNIINFPVVGFSVPECGCLLVISLLGRWRWETLKMRSHTH